MSENKYTTNNNPTLAAVSNADGETPVYLLADMTTGRLLTDTTITSPTYILRLDDTTTADVTYVGKAALASATSAAVWQIQRIDETSGMIITWGGTGTFNQVWDNRATTVVYS